MFMGGCIDLVRRPLLWLLVMSLKWNVNDVGNALTSACCVCSWGAECTDLVEWPIRGGQAWLKNLSIYERMLRRFNWSMVFGTCFWPRSYVVCSVCSWGGALTLSEVPCVGN